MTDLCPTCGQCVPEWKATMQIDVIVRAKIDPSAIITRGHVYRLALQAIDRWYSENTYDTLTSGELINTTIAVQDPNSVSLQHNG